MPDLLGECGQDVLEGHREKLRDQTKEQQDRDEAIVLIDDPEDEIACLPLLNPSFPAAKFPGLMKHEKKDIRLWATVRTTPEKDIRVFPSKAVLLQVSSEPGAVWALLGGIIFMTGIIILIILKVNRERDVIYS